MYASTEHNTVLFNKDVHLCVTIEYLYLFCTWHTNVKCFSPCVYSYFHRQLSDTFILSQKCQRFGCMSIMLRGRAMGSIENRVSLRLIHILSLSLTCFDRAESLQHNLSDILHFCTRMTRKIDKN